MEQPAEMITLSQVMERLRQKGYGHEIKMSDHGRMQGDTPDKIYDPEDLVIVKNFRFEGNSDPADNSVLYLVQDKEGNIGYIVDAYGAYSTNEGVGFDDFLKKIPTAEIDIKELFNNL